MESPTISVVGSKRGRGDVECEITGLDPARSVTAVRIGVAGLLSFGKPLLSVDGGVADGGDFIRSDGVDGEEWTEKRAGARRGAGVKCGTERRALMRAGCSGMGDGDIR